MSTSSRITLPLAQNLRHALPNITPQKETMPKGFNLRCAAGKTARVWLQGKGGALTPGSAFALLPIKEGETEESPVGHRASLRQADSCSATCVHGLQGFIKAASVYSRWDDMEPDAGSAIHGFFGGGWQK